VAYSEVGDKSGSRTRRPQARSESRLIDGHEKSVVPPRVQMLASTSRLLPVILHKQRITDPGCCTWLFVVRRCLFCEN
jgi:hypothetical protein